jgi:hypothetical protein
MQPIDITKMKSKKQLNKADGAAQFTTYPSKVSSQAEANEIFAKGIGSQGDGGSIGVFLALMARVMELHASFSWGEVVAENRLYGLDVWLLERLFNRFTTEMERLNILEATGSCYDDGKRFIRLA